MRNPNGSSRVIWPAPWNGRGVSMDAESRA